MPHYTVYLLSVMTPSAIALQSATLKHDSALLAQPEPKAAVMQQIKAPAPLTILQRQGGWYQVNLVATAQPAQNNTTHTAVRVSQQTTITRATDHGWLRLFNVQFVRGRYQPDNLPAADLTGLIQSNFQQVTSSTGVRGLDKVNIQQAKPDFAMLARLQAYQQTAAQAQTFATAAKLQSEPKISEPEAKP